jgi:hypothetical protein
MTGTMNTTDAHLAVVRHNNGWLQYSLRTLLVVVALVAAICAVGRHVGWFVAAGILVTVAVGGTVGRWFTRTDAGVARGAVWGLLLSLVAVLAASAYCVYRGYFHDRGEWRSPLRGSEIRSTPEMVRAAQRAYPGAQRITDTPTIEERLSAHYGSGPGLSGEELYFFPDRTYLFLRWADIFPETICDRGTWKHERGWVVLCTDGASDNEPRLFLPLIAREERLLAADGSDRNELSLFYALEMTWLRDLGEKEQSGTVEDRFLAVCLVKKEPIPKGSEAAIRNELYENHAPDELRWRQRSGKFGSAAVYLIAALFAVRIFTRRRNRHDCQC